jgi:hypothetical protein
MSPWGHKRRSGTNRNCQSLWRPNDIVTRKEIEQKMDELTDKYVETRNQKIIDELYKLTCELDELQKLEKQMKN